MNSETTQTESYGAVILYYRFGPQIVETIEALVHQSVPPASIVLVDNGSKDGICKKVGADYASVKVIDAGKNLGYAGGMNRGAMELSQQERILFLTHEVILKEDCVEQLIHAATLRPVVVGPVLARTGDLSIWSAGGYISQLGQAKHNTDAVSDRAFSEAEWLDGACLFVDHSSFRELNGFDEDYFLYWEDVDFCVRAQALGPVGIAIGALAFQETGTSPIYYRTRNRILFWKKRRAWFRVAIALAEASIQFLVLEVRGTASRDKRMARMLGLRDGITGQLTHSYSRVVESK